MSASFSGLDSRALEEIRKLAGQAKHWREDCQLWIKRHNDRGTTVAEARGRAYRAEEALKRAVTADVVLALLAEVDRYEEALRLLDDRDAVIHEAKEMAREIGRLQRIEEAAQAYVEYKLRAGKVPHGFFEWEQLRIAARADQIKAGIVDAIANDPWTCARCGIPFSRGFSGVVVNGSRCEHHPSCPSIAENPE